jgi:hypothetical protein
MSLEHPAEAIIGKHHGSWVVAETTKACIEPRAAVRIPLDRYFCRQYFMQMPYSLLQASRV